jgi:F-type H+-transporting ATPase subunit b
MIVRRGFFLLLASLLVLLWTAPGSTVLAQDKGGEHDHGAPGQHAPAKGDKHAAGDRHTAGDTHTAGAAEHAPALFNWALDLGVWTMVVFLLLLFIMSRFAWKPMLEGLRKREASIRTAMEEAKLARAETERIHVELQAERERSAREIARMMDEARRNAERLISDERTKLTQEIQQERDRLRHEIDTAKDQLILETLQQTARLATLVATKAVRRVLTDDDQRRLQEEAIAEVRSAQQQWQTQMQNGSEGRVVPGGSAS